MSAMREDRRTRLHTDLADTPRGREIVVSAEELAQAAGISLATLERLIRVGLVETDPHANAFTVATLVRLRRMLRLHEDLEVNLAGAAILVDVLERMEELEVELNRLRREL